MAIITQNRRIAYFYLGLLNRRKREKNVEILNENKDNLYNCQNNQIYHYFVKLG